MVTKTDFEKVMGRPIRIGNHHRQDKLLELLLEFNSNNELAQTVYDNGYHYENDKQFIQDDMMEMKNFAERVLDFLDNYDKMYPGKTK